MSSPDEPKTYQVANPAYVELEQLKTAVEGAQDSLKTALRSASALMQGGDAWTGPTTATTFAQEIQGRDQQLPGLVGQVLQAVEDALADCEPTLTRPLNRGMYE